MAWDRACAARLDRYRLVINRHYPWLLGSDRQEKGYNGRSKSRNASIGLSHLNVVTAAVSPWLQVVLTASGKSAENYVLTCTHTRYTRTRIHTCTGDRIAATPLIVALQKKRKVSMHN